MLVEIVVHEACAHWTMMLRKDMPLGAKTIMSSWSFECKQHSDKSISKYKARLCAHSGMQRCDIDYLETFAPVVYWISV